MVSKWMIWGNSDFRTQAIWFSGHFIIDNYYFAALDVYAVTHPVWSRLWSLCHHLSVRKDLRNFFEVSDGLRYIEKISNCAPRRRQVRVFFQQWSLSNGLSHTAAWIAIIRKWECNGNSIKINILEVRGFLETNNFVFLPILG